MQEHGDPLPRPRLGNGPLSLEAHPGPARVDRGSAGREISWQAAIDMAVARHPLITSATASLQQQSGMVDVARAGYRPRVQAGVTSGEQGEFGFGQVANVGVRQLLYDFGKVSSTVSREEAGVRRQEAVLSMQVDEIIERTAQALIEVHRFQELEHIAGEQVAGLREILELTEARAAAGVTPQSDPIQARARVEAAEAQWTHFRAQLRQWQGRLAVLTGPALPDTVSAPPEALLLIDALSPAPVDPRALPAVRAADARYDEAQADLVNTRAQMFPTLSLDVDMNHRLGAAGRRYEEIYGRSTYSSIQLRVDAPLYQGGELSARRRAGAHAVESALAEREAALLDAQDTLFMYQQQVLGMEGRIDMLRLREANITRTRALYWEQYLALGTRNALDLLNAEQEIAQSRQELVNARHDLWSAALGYLLTSGLARDRFEVSAMLPASEVPGR